jgi:S1-C subfamily serine protease
VKRQPRPAPRGGTIDSLIRLDLALSPAAEGGALVDVQGRVVGMAVRQQSDPLARSSRLGGPRRTFVPAITQLVSSPPIS